MKISLPGDGDKSVFRRMLRLRGRRAGLAY
jgi:hypothetical protein